MDPGTTKEAGSELRERCGVKVYNWICQLPKGHGGDHAPPPLESFFKDQFKADWTPEVEKELLQKIVANPAARNTPEETRYWCEICHAVVREGPHVHDSAPMDGLPEFTKYFCENYPGPDTVIFNPKWHAPKIFRAALSAMKLSAAAARNTPGKEYKHFQECNGNRRYPAGEPGHCCSCFNNHHVEAATRNVAPSIDEIGVGDVAWGIAKRACVEYWDAGKLGMEIAQFAIRYRQQGNVAPSEPAGHRYLCNSYSCECGWDCHSRQDHQLHIAEIRAANPVPIAPTAELFEQDCEVIADICSEVGIETPDGTCIGSVRKLADAYAEMCADAENLQSQVEQCEKLAKRWEWAANVGQPTSGEVKAQQTGWKQCAAELRQRLGV